MTDQDRVRAVLTADPMISNVMLGKQLGCSKETVRGIRSGRRFKDVLPDLPREYIRAQRCFKCMQWDAKRYQEMKCLLNFPESKQPEFAMECNFYKEVR